MADGHIWDVEAGGSNPLTQAMKVCPVFFYLHFRKKESTNMPSVSYRLR